MAAARLTFRLSQISVNSSSNTRLSGVTLLPAAAAAAAASPSTPSFTPPVRTCHIYRDPNYKTIPPNFHFKRKHYVPKFKRDRGLKFIKIDLPDPNEQFDPESMSPDEVRAKMKEKGIKPVRPWQEVPMYISATTNTFEPYVPPEGDGKVSTLSTAGAKQKLERIEKKGKSMMSLRKIRQFEEDFEPNEFVQQAQDIYIDAHKAIADKDKDKLHQCVTERAYPIVTHQSDYKTIRWQFLGSLEPPRVVHVRCTDVITKENIFAQITVRFHTKQILAVYDRFGRLLHGSEVVARDVLEYVVFEKHIANTYGLWRIHDKIIPDWMPPRQPIRKTYKVRKFEEEDEEEPPTPPPTKEEETQDIVTESKTVTDKPTVALA